MERQESGSWDTAANFSIDGIGCPECAGCDSGLVAHIDKCTIMNRTEAVNHMVCIVPESAMYTSVRDRYTDG